MDKFRHKLPKDDLKKFAKEIAKKLVASDYKHNRVEDPTRITPNQEKKVKKHVKEFFDKAVAKKAEHDRKKAEKQKKAEAGIYSTKDIVVNGAPDTGLDSETQVKVEESDDMDMSDEENEQVIPSGPVTPILDTPSDEGLKRKREDLAESFDSTPSETPSKRFKDEDVEAVPSPPPPPPPPPAEDLQMQIDEEAELAAQEEALMRENEEALMLENEKAMKDAELHTEDMKVPFAGNIDEVDARVNCLKREDSKAVKEANGNMVLKMEAGALDSEHGAKDVPETNGVDEKRDIIQHERKQVLSH
jgi:[histone H3]-lysine36 N-trimethyltransferase